MKTTAPITPGIHDLPAEQYHALPLASNSLLSHLRKSPAHLVEAIRNPKPPTPAMQIGSAVHTALLEPDLFAKQYVVSGPCDARKKGDGVKCGNPGKWLVGGEWLCGIHAKSDRFAKALEAKRAELEADGWVLTDVSEHDSHYFKRGCDLLRLAHHKANWKTHCWMARNNVQEIRIDLPPYGSDDPREVLSHEDYDSVVQIAEAVRRHPAAKPLLDRIEQAETSVVWQHHNGVTCKARIDGVAPSIATLIDLKTTRDASRDAFERAIFNFGYYRQAAHYLAGAAATMPEPIEHFVFIAVEKEPPYAVGVYRLDDEVIQFGRRELDELLELWPKAMQQADQAESYNANQIVDIALPEWAMRRMYHEIEHEF